MKRGAPRHPKIVKLAELLGIEIYSAAGILELLWHFTAEFAPAGDIGQHSNIAIARAAHWEKNRADELVKALVESGWLDSHRKFNLVVHNWQKHADNATNMHLARKREFFWDGSMPNLSRLPKDECALATQFYALHGSRKAHPVRTESAKRAKAGEGRASSFVDVVTTNTEVSTTELQVVSPLEQKIEEVALRIWFRHPAIRRNRCSKKKTKRVLREIVKSVPSAERMELLDEIDGNHTGWCGTFDWRKEGGKYALGLEKWINPKDELWRDAPPAEAFNREATKSERSLLDAGNLFEAMQKGNL